MQPEVGGVRKTENQSSTAPKVGYRHSKVHACVGELAQNLHVGFLVIEALKGTMAAPAMLEWHSRACARSGDGAIFELTLLSIKFLNRSGAPPSGLRVKRARQAGSMPPAPLPKPPGRLIKT